MNERSTYSPFPLIHLALDNAKLLIGVPLAAALAAVALSLVLGGRYTAESVFKPQSEQADMGRLSGLAAQFGINVPGSSTGESVDFYARLVFSRALLENVATREYRVGADGAVMTLVERYDERGDGAARLRRTVDRVAKQISVDMDLNAGVVGVRTRDRDRDVAEQINRAILDEVNRFNLERRQSQAAAEREFIDGQLADAHAELAAVEEQLSSFMQSNRRYEEWPELRFEAARLQSQVDLQRQLVTTLMQSLEQSRLDEVRNTPVVTIIDPPEGSAKRDSRLVQRAVLGAVLGLVLVLAWLFVREYTGSLRREYPDEYARVRQRRLWLGALLLVVAAGCDGSVIEPVEVPLAMVAVSAGANHTCALTDDGVAYCWGLGREGQLGNAAYASSDVPTQVVSPLRFRAISAGDAHTCALVVDGTPVCWGWNPYFQRGNPVDTATGRPVGVFGNHRFERLEAGSHHTCGLKADGTAWCWGYNRYGQLGDGTTATAAIPVQVQTSLRFNAITAGGHHTCGLAANASPNAYCWGQNSVGQLSAGTDTLLSTTPVRVRGNRRFSQISAGFDHVCAVAGGDVYCWGGNAYGQIGDGTTFPEGLPGAITPTPSPVPQSFVQVYAGMYSTCALAPDRRAYCWGRGGSGQLGIGSDSDQYLPQAVHLQPGNQFNAELLLFNALSVGAQHTCGVSLENTVYCWGNGTLGQLGVGGEFFAWVPHRVSVTEE